MSRWTRKTVGWVVGVFGMLAIGYGASVAFARPVNAMTCPPYDGVTFMGEQPSYQACYNACFAVHGTGLEQAVWNQTSHCCSCLY